MQQDRTQIPTGLEIPQITIRVAEWGGMSIESGSVREDTDPAPMFNGLPDNRCQCPHWGYVIKGSMTYKFASHDQVINAGEVYYAAPGHIPFLAAGCEYVEFSRPEELAKTMEVVQRNMAAAGIGH